MNNALFLIDQYGDWYYRESKITRHSMVKLFSTILVRDNDNTFHLRTPVEDVLVEVKDVPFIITEMNVKKRNKYIIERINYNISFIRYPHIAY